MAGSEDETRDNPNPHQGLFTRAFSKQIETAQALISETVSRHTRKVIDESERLVRENLDPDKLSRDRFEQDLEAVDAWIQSKSGEVKGFFNRPRKSELEQIEDALIGITAAIRQISDRQASRILSIATSKITGAAAAGGVVSLITAFGSASTGTAIASLSGAAATSAQLYWIGSLFGLGAVGGGLILTGGALGIGIAGAQLFRRYVMGTARKEEDFEDYELAVLTGCIGLAAAMRQQIELGDSPPREDMRIVARDGLLPIIHQLDAHWDRDSLDGSQLKAGVRSLRETLSPISLHRLEHQKTALTALTVKALA